MRRRLTRAAPCNDRVTTERVTTERVTNDHVTNERARTSHNQTHRLARRWVL